MAALLVALGCGSSTTAVLDTSLDGPWSTHAAGTGVGVVLNLVWSADSVTGSGTYTALDQSLGCGGTTLRGSGTVRFVAGRSGAAISGAMLFDNGWTPPYTGSLENGSHISGAFRSIDAGSCGFDLYRGLVP
jgi:hypothetical protein